MRVGFFDSIMAQIMDSFSCSTLNSAFLFFNKLTEVPEYAEMLHDGVTLT